MLEKHLEPLNINKSFIRVFIVDELCKLASGASLADPPTIILFKKSIETSSKDWSTREVLGHELLHQLNLRHSFHNESPFTFKYKTTTNAMDYSSRIYSLGPAQWNIMRTKAQAIWNKMY